MSESDSVEEANQNQSVNIFIHTWNKRKLVRCQSKYGSPFPSYPLYSRKKSAQNTYTFRYIYWCGIGVSIPLYWNRVSAPPNRDKLYKQIQPRNLTVLISISSQCANSLQLCYTCTVWSFYLGFIIFYFTPKTRETINVSGLLFQGLKKQHPFTQSHSKSDWI